jgi:hypothetical protein
MLTTHPKLIGHTLASYPRPSFQEEEEEKGPVTHCAGGHQKKLGDSDTIVYSPFIVYRTARHTKHTNDHYGNATGRYGDPGTCARSVYQALSPPPLERKGLGTRLAIPLQSGGL